MIIRKANIQDVQSIVYFQVLMARETENIELNQETVAKGVNAVLADQTKGTYYIAENNDKVVGSLLTTFEWSDWRNGTVLWIQSVFVLPEFRRKGVYSQLYSHLKTMVLEDNNLKGIRLYADKLNKPALATYKKLGMNPDHYVTFEWLK